MTLEFGLLGDIEVRRDGQRLDIGHARQRCVLAALLVDVNKAVPAEQLIDRVWADAVPHRARNALAAYISRLRQPLADVQIMREPGGYLLVADALSVDLHRFRADVVSARAATDPQRATELFNQALGRWRGQAFATIDTPWFNDLRNSLESERVSVVLDRNDRALQAGRHAEVLGELTTGHQAEPLDERLAGQLMLAQYSTGRQADALETYRQVRARLIDQLGVDPGPALQDVHQRILAGESAVAGAPPSQAASGAAATPLPRRATTFVGRQTDVDCVAAALREGSLVTLVGVGGVGKTRLALEVADQERRGFADGVAICELAPIEDGATLTHAVAASLRLQQQQGLGIEETVIDYLRSRALLLVVDNCEHLLDAAAQLLDRIATHCPRVVVLTTSREALGVPGEQTIPVSPLAVQDATALFSDRARATRPDFDLGQEPVGVVAEICRQLDGLPLAIELAAARTRMMSSLEIARRLDSLRLLTRGGRGVAPRQQSLAATIDWSYQLLSEPEQLLFAKLSAFAGGFDLAAAHGVCGPDDATEDDTLDLLTGLVDKSMVIVRESAHRTRYGVLATLRSYGRDQLRDNGIDALQWLRHAAYYTELAEAAAAGMHGADEQAWVQRMLPDHDNLRAAFEYADSSGHTDLAIRLVTSLSEFVHLRIGYESSIWAERVLELVDREHPLYAAAAGYAARGAWNRGDFTHARALAQRAEGRLPGRGNGRVAYPADVLADLDLYDGNPAAALAHYDAEMTRARVDADPIRLVWTLFYVAICHAALRRPEDGVAAAEEALAVSDATQNPSARSMARYALGLVLKKSDPARALALFDEAADLAAAVQNFWWHGIALMEAAATRAVHGEPADAARSLALVIDHWDRVGDWSQQWLNLRYLTRFLLRVGADDDAAALHRALVRAGRLSPLSTAQVAALGAADAETAMAEPAVDVLSRARAALARFGAGPSIPG